MFDPENEEDTSRLLEAIEWSDRRLEKPREYHVEHLKRFVGPYYSDEGGTEKRPINMIELGVNIFQRALASHAPQTKVDSNYPQLAPDASDMELAVNQEIQRIGLRDSFNTCTREALFRLGMMEVGIVTKNTPPDGEGYQYDPGHVFADPILFGDSILDMSASTPDQMAYVGHKFSVPLEWAQENREFHPKRRKVLTAPSSYNVRPEQRASSLGQGSGMNIEEFEDTVRLQQVFLPRQQLVLIFHCDGTTQLPLQIIDWEGPERGPYHRLSYNDVQGNILPIGLVPVWYDLDDSINRLTNKSIRQAERQKTITGVLGGADDDGNRALEAKDGSMVKLDDPNAVREFRFGGAEQVTLGMIVWLMQKLEDVGGNWRLLGGLGSQTRTLGQDELLFASANVRMQDLQQTTVEFQTSVINDLAFWMWSDPISQYNIIKQVEDTPIVVSDTWSMDKRNGNFWDYNFSVNPYSAIPKSPGQEANEFIQILLQVIPALMPAMQERGQSLDTEFILKTLANYKNMPALKRAIIYSQGEAKPERGPVNNRMPQSTTRNYVRESRSGDVTSDIENSMLQDMFAPKSQNGQPTMMPGMEE